MESHRSSAASAQPTQGRLGIRPCRDRRRHVASAELLADEKAKTAIGFLGRAVRCVRRHGVRVERVLTDNGSADRSTIHAIACRILGLKHLRTRPYRPQANGKAERSSARRSAAGPTLELSADGCA